MTPSPLHVSVVGATGIVGAEMLRVLEERAFPVGELRAFASPRSEGRKLAFAGGEVTCEVLRDGCFDGTDLARLPPAALRARNNVRSSWFSAAQSSSLAKPNGTAKNGRMSAMVSAPG